MQILNAARLTRAPGAALGAIGLFWGVFAAMMPMHKARLALSDQDLGTLLVIPAIGGMISMYFAPKVYGRFGVRAIPVLAALIVVAAILPALVASKLGFGLALLIMGISIAGLDVCSNLRISALEAHHKGHLMSVNHAIYSFGFCVSAALVGLMRQNGFSYETVIIYSVGAIATVALLTFERAPLALAIEPHDENAPKTKPWFLVTMFALILAIGFMAENATEAWSALHIERTLGAPSGEGSFGPAMLGLMMGLGRLSGQGLATRLGEGRLIFFSSFGAIIGALIIALAPTKEWVFFGVAILALGVAVVVPAVNALIGQLARRDQVAYVMSRAWMVGILGFFIGPTLMGLISEHFGLRFSFGMISVILAVIIPAMLLIKRRYPQMR